MTADQLFIMLPLEIFIVDIEVAYLEVNSERPAFPGESTNAGSDLLQNIFYRGYICYAD